MYLLSGATADGGHLSSYFFSPCGRWVSFSKYEHGVGGHSTKLPLTHSCWLLQVLTKKSQTQCQNAPDLPTIWGYYLVN
jgi:hypothetical protein